MKEQVRLAYQIQKDLLPKSQPDVAGYDIAARSIPAQMVGGDYFDFIDVENGSLAIFLGALSIAAGRLTEFQLFAADGLGRFTPPVPELAMYGQYLIGGTLALLFMWAFEMDSLIRRVALILGFTAMVLYEPLVIERFPDVYATFFSPGYVAGKIG